MKQWMKTLLALLTALTIACGAIGFSPVGAVAEAGTEAAAEAKGETTAEAGEGSPALPAVGEVIHGFEVKEIKYFQMLQAQLVYFEHQKTGAGLLYIVNEDTNRAFQLTFRTRPQDDTGLPHVFEHSTICGSEKYPSKDLFFNIVNQTYHTYINAYTTDAMTCYPVASLSEEQLLKYADFYTDSCLHPIVLQDESIFRQEAWRYSLEDPEAELTLEGTVYTEQKGTYTLETFALNQANKLTFPGSVLGLSYGGDPDYIPDMTYESLKNYHSLYYHPSNCMAFLYGKFEDYTRFLALLDDAFSEYEKSDFTFADSGYTPITEPVEMKITFPTEAGTPVDHRSTVIYYIVCPGLRENPEEQAVIDNLISLLNVLSSPLQQRLRKVLPSGAFSCGREVAAPDDAIIFMMIQANEEDAQLFRDTVNEVLRDIAENGLPQDMVDDVAAAHSMSNRLAVENGSPVDTVLYSLAYEYATTGDIFQYVKAMENTDRVSQMNQDGLYAKGAAKWLTDNPITSLLTVCPEPGAREEKDAALKQKLAEIKAGMTPEELQAIVDQSHAEPEPEDTSEMIAQLQAVTVKSLPEEIREYQISDVTGEDGIRRLDVVANVDRLGEPAIYLDISGLPQEDIHWMRLYLHLLSTLPTDAHTLEELSSLIVRYLSSLNIDMVQTETSDEDFRPWVRTKWICDDADLAAGYDLVKELLFHTQLTDTEELLKKVQAVKASILSSINSNPLSDLAYRSFGLESLRARYVGYCNYSEYYSFLDRVEAALAENPEEAVTRLTAVQEFLNNNAGAASCFAGNAESIALNRPLADAFLASLGHTEREKATYDLPVSADREALIINANVQYNCLFATFSDMGMEGYDASLEAIAHLVEDIFLFPILRDGYGAYTPDCSVSPLYGIHMITYSDPNIRETYDVYASISDRLAALEIDQATLDGYILSSYSGKAKPKGELSGATATAEDLMAGEDPMRNLKYMRELKEVTPDTVKNAAELFSKAWDNGVKATAGGLAAVQENADLFDVIRNPFNAQDTSAVVFEDVPEDNEKYAAVRFVFENGYMAPLSDTLFGLEETATVSDFLVGLCAIIGNPVSDGAAARDFMASYGLVAADQDPEAPLTEELLMNVLVSGLGVPGSTDTPEATVPRGDLAVLFFQLMQGQ